MAAAVGGGCGTNPLGPAPHEGSALELRVVSGDTGEPVAAASVRAQGATYLTDARGVATLASRGEIEIESAAHLTRRTQATDAPVSLWPRTNAYPESYVRALMYQRAYLTRETAAGPEEALRRMAASTVSVVPDAELSGDPDVLAAHERAAAELTAACEQHVRFVVRTAAAGTDPVIRTGLEAGLQEGSALAYRELRGDAIVGGRIAFASRAIARDVRFVTHELGHVLGLEHSLVRSDLMYFEVHTGTPQAFSPNERLSVRLLLQRQPGNRFPDSDPQAGSRSQGARGETIVD
jgi:hypothetical protein